MRHLRAMVACAMSLAATGSFAEGFNNLSARSGWQPFVGLGFTSGGDTFLKVRVVPVSGNGPTYREDVSSGGGIDLRLGASRRLGDLPLTVQFTGAYHNDQVSGIEGSKYKFRRLPVEATLLWHATDRARIGFGVRKATNATFKIDNGQFTNAQGTEITYSGQARLKASTGFVVEAEYAMTPTWGLKGRYVFESYRFRDDPQGEKLEANHLGVMSVWYFD